VKYHAVDFIEVLFHIFDLLSQNLFGLTRLESIYLLGEGDNLKIPRGQLLTLKGASKPITLL
jgi:hypothetical protein